MARGSRGSWRSGKDTTVEEVKPIAENGNAEGCPSVYVRKAQRETSGSCMRKSNLPDPS